MNVAGLLAAATVAVLGAAMHPHPTRDQLAPDPPSARRKPAATPAARSDDSAVRSVTTSRAGSGSRSPDEIAQWCDEIARAARSGSTLTAAVRGAPAPAQLAVELAAVHLALDRGVALATALEHAPVANADVQLAFTVLRACAEHGGPAGEPIDRAAATLRGRAADLAERRTHSAQARMSAVVMTWLPVAMLALLLVTSASVRTAVTGPVGLFVVASGAILNLVGWRWMGRIIEGGR
jgi:Flp pilus assembly protein TadB